MMRLFDGITLAGAKLRAHRVRTGIITSVVALLFSLIVLVLCVLTGATQSMKSFGKEGLGGRFIVKATPIVDNSPVYGNSPVIMDKLVAEATRLRADKKATAKKLDVQYDANNDPNLPYNEYDFNGTKSRQPNLQSSFTQSLVREYMFGVKGIGDQDFDRVAKSSGATTTYRSTNAYSTMPMSGNGQQYISPIIDGKEKGLAESQQQSMGPPQGVSMLAQGMWSYFDRDLLKPFVLEGQNLELGSDGSVPVLAPMSAAEQFLKLNALQSSASPDEQIARLVAVRKDIAGKQAELCYRNQASSDLVNQAKQQIEEMERNKKKKDYVAPSLQYNLPVTPCGEVTVKKDTRTADEKKRAANEISFKKMYENYQEPMQGIIKLRIVGILPDMQYSAGFSAKDILRSMLQSGLGDGWFSPINAIQKDSLSSKIRDAYIDTVPADRTYYAEFPTYESAKKFIKQQTCTFSVNMQDMMQYSPNEPDKRTAGCIALGKLFDVSPFANNASAIEDLRQAVWRVMKYVAPVVLLVASLVLMGVVGKIIADSRRETAVFRALGATRGSIAQIYVTYGLYIAAAIGALAVAIGSLGAYLVSNYVSPMLSVTAVLAYNAADVHKQFTVFGMDLAQIGFVFVLIVLAALLSTVLPLLTNVRRNPIRDMRDE